MPRHAASSLRGQSAALRILRYNTYFGNDEYYTPLPVRALEPPGPIRDSAPLVDCLTEGIRICEREFSGPGFRMCVYGMMTASGMLPAGVAQSVGRDVISADGAYAEGLSLACPASDPRLWRTH